ncbi:MAG: hypothetical protein AB1813_02250 [Verrucomicrobiota bacterium]|jgi:hypothetical protein
MTQTADKMEWLAQAIEGDLDSAGFALHARQIREDLANSSHAQKGALLSQIDKILLLTGFVPSQREEIARELRSLVPLLR